MPASFSYVLYLHPVASNWRLPEDPITAADGAVQHTDRLLRLLRRKNRQDDDDGEQRGAARHKIFALRFEDISLGSKGSNLPPQKAGRMPNPLCRMEVMRFLYL